MPRSAIAAGCVDFILAPKRIAQELARIAKHPSLAGQSHQDSLSKESAASASRPARRVRTPAPAPARPAEDGPPLAKTEIDGLQKILLLLRHHSGVDFSLYKTSTIGRRVHRRMVLNKQGSLAAYARFARGNGQELAALYSDVLISVTSFFRDPEVFEFLKRRIFL